MRTRRSCVRGARACARARVHGSGTWTGKNLILDETLHATPYRNNFTVFTLNAQSLNSKFSEIQSLISELSKDNLLFDAICFQETWLHTNDDVGIFHLPAYNIIHKDKICCGHGG